MESNSVRTVGDRTLVDLWIDGKFRAISVTRRAIEVYLRLPPDRGTILTEDDRREFVRTHLSLVVQAASAELARGSERGSCHDRGISAVGSYCFARGTAPGRPPQGRTSPEGHWAFGRCRAARVGSPERFQLSICEEFDVQVSAAASRPIPISTASVRRAANTSASPTRPRAPCRSSRALVAAPPPRLGRDRSKLRSAADDRFRQPTAKDSRG